MKVLMYAILSISMLVSTKPAQADNLDYDVRCQLISDQTDLRLPELITLKDFNFNYSHILFSERGSDAFDAFWFAYELSPYLSIQRTDKIPTNEPSEIKLRSAFTFSQTVIKFEPQGIPEEHDKPARSLYR